ncbi:MAG: nitrile hydratase accessory protein [Geodermatophilaceae bacterium]|nr:nitrile hydratase accessory protein [Geodermatophilaceae bacterium]MDQ3454814.1 nitrile hydratase accessory protein [Actinomycetota bacterium]
MRTDTTTEVGEARRRVERLLSELPRDGEEQLSFTQPWELRAFAVAVAAHQNGLYDWSEFQLALIGAIRQWEDSAGSRDDPFHYYDRWLEALESVLSGTGVLDGSELDHQASVVLATPRNADHHHARRDPVAVDPAHA